MDGSTDDFPVYVKAAFGHDRSWMVEGLCHPSNNTTDPMFWIISGEEKVKRDGHIYRGSTCEAAAMELCRRCPQQWLCARYAVETDVRTCTWGVPYEDIQWLKNRKDGLNIIDHARANEITVEKAVHLVRRAGAKLKK